MKRNGFVANSSSSSFILVGHKATIEDVLSNPDGDYMCVGGWLGEGRDIFMFLKEYAELVQKWGWDGYTIVDVVKYCYDPDSIHVENATVWGGTADQNSTDSVEEFIGKYLEIVPEPRVVVETFEELDETFIKEVMGYIGARRTKLALAQVIPHIMGDFYGVNEQMAKDLLKYYIVKEHCGG